MPGAPCLRRNCMTSRSSGQNAFRPWRDHILLITRYCLCTEWISPNSCLCIYNKNCRHANGDNRHFVPDVPTGLDRDIRDMPIACARTHPDANKHARHIPMCRPAHGNKCSHRCISIARAFMGCPSDNLRGHQRRQIWCHVKSTFSVYLLLKYIDISLISYRLAMITR